MDDNLRRQCVDRVNAILALARSKYGDLPFVAIRFFPKGRAAGWAGRDETGYFLRFNIEALEKFPDHTLNNMVPHEVAHIVCFVKNWDRGHGRMWRMVCSALGGNSERCHNLGLTKAKQHTKYEYRASCGTVCYVGLAIHRKIQQGQRRILRRTWGIVGEEHYTGQQKT